MELYFLRHASAGQSLSDPKKDEKRPLDKEGVEQSIQMGRLLSALGIEFDAIVTSPLTRAAQTATLAARQLGQEDRIVQDDALRPDASYDDFQELLRKNSRKKSVMVVGHNPSFSEFLSLLVSDNASENTVELKKGGLAKLDVKQQRGTLRWYITPKLLAAVTQTTSASNSRPKTSRK
jgi:phosphohistidine phosphatase